MPAPRDSRTIPALATLLGTALLFTATFFLVTGTFSSVEETTEPLPPFSFFQFHLDYFVERPLDTLLVMDTCYLEVRIDSQQVIEHCKSAVNRTMLCSTGNIKIKKAIETTEGIFCVQSKTPLAYSRQFDSTKMYFWVGFNGNIGFHGLDGKSYYRFLGKRPSSHGCIRMRREDAEWMFNHIPIGTPVYVHSGNAARCLMFTDSIPINGIKIQSSPSVRAAMNQQLHSLYTGRRFIDGVQQFYFYKSNVWWGGIPIGNIAQMPLHQRMPPFASGVREIAMSDRLAQRQLQ